MSSSEIAIDEIGNNDLTKRILNQVNIDDWPDEYGKCGHPRVLHRELHRVSACSELRESPDELRRIWTEYRMSEANHEENQRHSKEGLRAGDFASRFGEFGEEDLES